jgi:hypothetical protein
MMAIVMFLEKISASKATVEKKSKDQKELFQKEGAIMCHYTRLH